MDDHDVQVANDVLSGDIPLDISHAGGEFEAVFEGLDDDLLGSRR